MKKLKSFLPYILAITIQCMAPLGLFDAPASPPPSYRSEMVSLPDIFVSLPNEEYNIETVNTIIDKISYFPPKLIDRLIAKGEKMKLINGRLTDEPEYEYLKGKIPKGWEDTGYTWDDVPGIGGNPIVVRIDSCTSNITHSSTCLEMHEVAHRINALEGVRVSDGYEFKKLWKSEAPKLFFDNPYFIQNCNEYFAECYAMYLYSDDMRAKLKKKAPLTYKFLTQDFYNPLPKPDLSVYRFGGSKICGGLYKNMKYDKYSDIVTDAYFKTSDHIYIAFAATNYGPSTGKPLRLTLWVDGKEIFRTYQGPIEEGYICRLWNISIGKLSPGIHSIIYEADSNSAISETDENNNWTEYKIEVE